jgi:ABC-type transport system involved in multi-copper enzyme maturation permease subunit
MLWVLIEKELKSIIQSPKFVATFGVCSLLILLSLFIGINEYRASVAQYETATSWADQQLSEATSFEDLPTRIYRQPDPMQIFVSGVNYDIGRLSQISSVEDIKLEQSAYSDDPLFAVFRSIDFGFIVQVVLSLFAIVFTYDAINGERENGTLKLVLSNSISRGKYLFAKLAGSWLGLTIPLLIPILIGLLLLIVYRVPMTNTDWMKVITLLSVSILYFTFFIALGLLVSALTRQSAVSFLILLVAWITLVLIVPRGSVMAAGQLVSVPSVAEIESQKDRYRADRQGELRATSNLRYQEMMEPAQGMPEAERRAFYTANIDLYTQERNRLQAVMETNIEENNRRVNENLRNAKTEQERFAFLISRVSPASAYKLTAMNLGGTNTSMKNRYEDQMLAYRGSYTTYIDTKWRGEQAEQAAVLAEQRRGGGAALSYAGAGNEAIDISDMPRFVATAESVSEVIRASILDFGLLTIFTLLAFAGAFFAFIRYDIR